MPKNYSMKSLLRPVEIMEWFSRRRLIRWVARRLRQTSYIAEFVPEALNTWLSRKVLFTLLPIALAGLFIGSYDGEFVNILRLPEWSFAAIVLYDAAIGKLMYMSGNPRSLPYKWDNFARILLFPLVISAATFMIGFVREYRKAETGDLGGVVINGDFLWITQVVLLAVALLASFFTELVDISVFYEWDKIPKWISKYRYYDHMIADLNLIRRKLLHIGFAYSRKGKVELFNHGGVTNTEEWTTDKEGEMIFDLEHIIEMATQLRHAMMSAGTGEGLDSVIEDAEGESHFSDSHSDD